MPTDLPERRRVTRWQVLRTRHSASEIRAQLDAGRWRRWGQAIVLHNGPLTRREQFFVAREHGVYGRSMLTSFSALELAGLKGWNRDQAHVLTQRGSRNSQRCPVPVRFHEIRDREPLHGWAHGSVQVTRQAAVIAAASLPEARSACGLLVAAVQQRVTSASKVRLVLNEKPNVRHRRLLVMTLDDIEQGADALSEIDFVRLCRRYGLPAPTQQAVRRLPGGARRYLDASWLRPDGRTLAVEVDGALHLSQRSWWQDQSRQNELVLADTVLLRYPTVVVRTDEARVASQVRRGLLLRG